MEVFMIIIAIVVLILILFISKYNSLIRLKNRTEESEAQIEVHEKQRYDLVPNLVETVKGYASHEKETLNAVIEARNTASKANNIFEAEEGNKQLGQAITKIFALSESYPDLKANQNFMELQKELSSIEEKILNARKYYNAVVREFNIACEVFPSNIVAGIMHLTKKQYLEVEEEAKQRVDVKF